MTSVKHSKVTVLLLLINYGFVPIGLRGGGMFGPCFVVHYLVSFLFLQSSRGGRESCLLYFNCL